MNKDKIKDIVAGAFSEGVEIREVFKNGRKLTGIALDQNNTPTPVTYLEDYTGSDEEIAEQIVQVLKEHMDGGKEIDISLITEWEKARKTVIPALINAEVNASILSDTVYTPLADLAVTYRVIVDGLYDGAGIGSVLVKNDLLKEWGITQEELDEAARKNLEDVCVCESMDNILNIMTCALGSTPKLMVVTNKTKYYGAASILSLSVQKKLREEMETYYIVPSSVNEIICVPNEVNLDNLKMLVREINRTYIPAEEFLSDNIYVQYPDGFLQVVETKNAVNA